MANLVFSRPNTSVVEVGYLSGTPEIYFEQARFLHLRYFAIVALKGSYGSPLTITDAQVRCVMKAIFDQTSCKMDGVRIS